MATLSDRLDLLESAVGSALAIDLTQYTPAAAISARNEAITKAAQDISDLVDEVDREKAIAKAAAEAGRPLTDRERIERLEALFG